MSLENQIYTRKSCRNYLDGEIDIKIIHEFIANARALIDNIDYSCEILTPDKLNIRTRWKAPYYLALFSEKKDNYLENIGFVFQQVCLSMQSIGIGNCWVGMASLKKSNPDFVIVISFGKSDNMTREMSQFKRKNLSEISNTDDERLIPAQLAPSAINSQPWFYKRVGDEFDVYQTRQNFLKRRVLKKWNPIDVGISLAHMYVANPDSFEFFKKSDFEDIKGYTYTGSIKI